MDKLPVTIWMKNIFNRLNCLKQLKNIIKRGNFSIIVSFAICLRTPLLCINKHHLLSLIFYFPYFIIFFIEGISRTILRLQGNEPESESANAFSRTFYWNIRIIALVNEPENFFLISTTIILFIHFTINKKYLNKKCKAKAIWSIFGSNMSQLAPLNCNMFCYLLFRYLLPSRLTDCRPNYILIRNQKSSFLLSCMFC